MRGLWSTLALVLVLAGLGAYIYFVDSTKPAAGVEVKEKVFAVEADAIREIRLTAGGETSVLQKSDDGWKLTEPVDTDADATEASSLVTNLASVEINRVVEEHASNLEPYGLATPRVTVAFTAEGSSGELRLGNTTPTQGDVYATMGDGTKVFLVSSYLETTFDKKPFDLRDKRIVRFERDKVENVQIARGAETMTFARNGSEWTVTAPSAGRADYSTVEGLLTRLSTAGMASIADPQPASLATYGLDKPSISITLGAGSSQTVLDVGRADGETRYARDRSRPMVFTLDTTLTSDLTKSFDDYRKKDLFDFRPFNVDRVRLSRGAGAEAGTWDLEKTRGTDQDQWRISENGGTARDADHARVEDLLSKLTSLRASSFAARPARTGLDRPALTVGVSYDGGKFERVRIGQAGSDRYGQHEGEAAVGLLDEAAVTAALEALDAAVAPPAPPPPSVDAEKKP